MLCKDPRTVAAGGASEMEIARQLSEFGKKETGLDQYAIAKYAESLEVTLGLHVFVLPSRIKSQSQCPKFSQISHGMVRICTSKVHAIL